MSARTVPTMPDWTSHEVATSALLEQITTYARFWADPPMFSMYQTLVQSIADDGAFHQITCDTLEDDTDSGRALISPWTYTIPVGMGGRWRISGASSWSGNATGVRAAAIYVNAAQYPGAFWSCQAAPAANVTTVGGTRTIIAHAGDTVALMGFQHSGGALNTNVAAVLYSYFEGRLESLANP